MTSIRDVADQRFNIIPGQNEIWVKSKHGVLSAGWPNIIIYSSAFSNDYDVVSPSTIWNNCDGGRHHSRSKRRVGGCWEAWKTKCKVINLGERFMPIKARTIAPIEVRTITPIEAGIIAPIKTGNDVKLMYEISIHLDEVHHGGYICY